MRRRDQNGSCGECLGCVEWIKLAQGRDWWRAVVNMIMKIRVLVSRNLFHIVSYFNFRRK
jgi:hypothetical protein